MALPWIGWGRATAGRCSNTRPVVSKFNAWRYAQPVSEFPAEQLETERLLLRIPRMSDAREIFASYAADPVVSRYMLWEPHGDMSETHLFVASIIHSWRSADEERPWVIIRQQDNALLGMVSATVTGHMVEIGYVLGRAFWNQGYTTEALQVVVDSALADPRIYRLSATVAPENPASARVLEKTGFKREATLARYHIFPALGPEPRDTWLYSNTRP
ncbi:MAG: ribosomal-protein-alanine N-acetyltransferase [Myxococcota bacterium]|jgi:ribosomal-protein-alanine N-acetyltransferase